jgi:hypothetical protein
VVAGQSCRNADNRGRVLERLQELDDDGDDDDEVEEEDDDEEEEEEE